MNGNSAHLNQEEISTQHIQSIQPEVESVAETVEEPSSVVPEVQQEDAESVLSSSDQESSQQEQAEGSGDSSIIDGDDPSRWGEIIDALKSGGFGT